MTSPPNPHRRDPPRFMEAEESRRLLTTANIALRRGSLTEAERAAQDALARLPGDPAAQEMLGDVRMAQERFDDAAAAYREALRDEPGRATAEAKLARATLRKSEHQRKEQFGFSYTSEDRALMRGRGAQDSGSRTGAALASAALPGLGQIITGEFVKGGILLAVFGLGCLLLTYAGVKPPFSIPTILAFIVLLADWVYAVADAAKAAQ